MSYYHADADQRAKAVAARIERMHDWLERQADGKVFEVWVESSGRIVWSWERTKARASSAGTFTNKIGLSTFREAIYAAYDERRVA